MTDWRNPFDEKDRTFYRAYGVALANWVQVERCLGSIFLGITKLSPELAGAVFFSARSFLGRADMVTACLPFANTTPEGREFIERVISRARAYSGARNSLAHDEHACSIGPDNSAESFTRVIRGPKGETLGLEQIQTISRNFFDLSLMVMIAIGQQTLVREPGLSLAAIDLLPLDPLASAADHSKLSSLLSEIEHYPR